MEFGQRFALQISGAPPGVEVRAHWWAALPRCAAPDELATALGAAFSDDAGDATLEVSLGSQEPVGRRYLQVALADQVGVSNVVRTEVSDVLTGTEPPGGAHYVVRGAAEGDLFGLAAAPLGIDGAQGPLVAVGAPAASDWSGAVYLLSPACCSGNAPTAPSVLSEHLQDRRVLTATGRDAAGSSLATADVDADGHPDLVVGAPGLDQAAGAVYVVRGPLEDGVLQDRATLQIRGARGDGLGSDVALHDRRIAAAGHGGVWLLDATPRGTTDAQDAPVRITAPGSDVPWTVASDDLDGDGVADLVVGIGDGRGAMHVLWGPVTADVQLDLPRNAPRDHVGRDVAVAGDLDGDGLPDVLVGAPGTNDNAGRVEVWVGSDPSEPWLRVDGVAPADGLGARVAPAGDLDGDGLAELVVGAPEATLSSEQPRAGAVYLFYAPQAGRVSAADADFLVRGRDASDRAGAGLMGGADLDGDGFDDLLLGAGFGWDPATDQATATSGIYVFRGAPGW